MSVLNAKVKGAYYTPSQVAETLVRWAVRSASDRLLDPSCGDGQFLACHRNAAGIEQDVEAVAIAARRTPARIYVGDFFDWCQSTRERFDCAAGNPPFIRYQLFSGSVRERALEFCRQNGVKFSALSSSWAPFLVGAATLLKPGGRMAFVVPAEIGHSPYAAPLIEYLLRSFKTVRIVAIKQSIFPELSQDVWLLYADDYGRSTHQIGLTCWARFKSTTHPPRPGIQIPVESWRNWKNRVRPFVLPPEVICLYDRFRRSRKTMRLGDVARVGIGYVTGANDFFHLRPSDADALGIPKSYLKPSVRNARALPPVAVSKSTIKDWLRRDEQCLLLRLQATDAIPTSVQRYLDSELGQQARITYKCRNRSPWYAVPDVVSPDGFMAYMSNGSPSLVANRAGCTCTNSVHAVRLLNGHSFADLQSKWQHPLTVLSTEIEGHPLGGGMLKLEPREAAEILIPTTDANLSVGEREAVERATQIMRAWRHYE